ncbi:MAG TPA: DNA translocase FtsK [bacterium]|nr:DNA translocase FtsK [bacterium]
MRRQVGRAHTRATIMWLTPTTFAGLAPPSGWTRPAGAHAIQDSGSGSVSLLQRKMKTGYVRAVRIVDQLEEKGIVGPAQDSSPRDVLAGVDELERFLKGTPTSPR